ncbi:sensor histidine kinase [Actinoplanes sp. CA-051413]|uniref:sensor histidine kinase n=1 Tax=Actinoplanes sp. CA-051413 TaxID=3239899 RepID=UPI003D985E64
MQEVRQRPARRSRVWPVTGATLLALVLMLLLVGADGVLAAVMPSLIAVGAVALAAWAIWRSHTDRVAYEARLTRWAASEAVLAERLRLAGDLHDIVSHGLGLITVRAAAARLSGDPGEAREALSDIESAGREATAELRRMLTVLRTAGDAGPRQPAEDLGRLPAIVSDARATGVRARLTLEPMGPVSPGAQVAICRTVREALHNVARHAGPSDVRVHVHRDGDTVVASVHDSGPDGPWPGTPGAGHGLIGVRERVTGLGGTLHAGPVEQGFRVVARIPDREPG